MDLRDYFAAKAMLGLVSGDRENLRACVTETRKGGPYMPAEEAVSICAYEMADAMLKVREQ